jgi:hypothetical protein
MTRRGMRYFLLFVSLVWLGGMGYCQTPVSLPIDFEGGTVGTTNYGPGNFTSFVLPTTATVEDNPSVDSDNPSAQVGRIVRTSSSDYDGGYLDLTSPLIFTATSNICMKVYTTAPTGTPVVLKLEDGPAFELITKSTTVSEGWQTLCFDPPGAPTNFTRLTFLFNFPTSGNGTYFFDDIFQLAELDGFELALPINFEGLDNIGNPISDDNFGPLGDGHLGANGFNGGEATVIDNPNQTTMGGANPSDKVAQIIRHSGTNAGAYIDLPEALVLDLDPILCMNVFTTADVDTEITLRIEDSSNSSIFMESVALTTVSGGWDTLCFVFHNAPPTCDRLTFYFDRGNTGDGSASSTFLFDDIYQPLTPSSSTIFFTPGSQFFCPPSSFTFTYPEDGEYKWFDENGVVVATGPDFTTPLLGGTTPFFVQDTASVALPQTDVGPTLKGSSDPQAITASVFFTSKISNGFWHSVDIVEKIVGGVSPHTCQYIVEGINLIQGASEFLLWNHIGASDNSQWTYTFPDPIPMTFDDEMELRVSVSGDVGCSISSHFAGGDVITTYPTSTTGGELVFTSHTPIPNHWMGFDYQVSGDLLADPTIYQVNAIADCASPLPIQLIDFSVREDNGDALLIWSTASELNNDRFLLLRTVDGIEYETAGIVSGAGNSSTVLNYSFRDRNPEKGLSYYKLRQVDFDGTKTDSEPMAYTNDTSGEFRLFPNPTHRNLTLSTALPYEQVDVIIYDLSGRVINRLNYGAIENQDFELEGHPGTYFVEILVDGERKAIFNVLKL